MRKCIWCLNTEDKKAFKSVAHTIPRKLGGQFICVNVCDDCNSYFGNHSERSPSIDTVLKETFGISQARLLAEGEIGKNKSLPRFSSIYFKVDFKNHKIDLKSSYKHQRGFQERIGRQMKKGIYKIFLEETERQKQTAHESKYDFIREFARYGLGNYPILYFERLHGIILTVRNWVKNPAFFIEKEIQMKYLVNEPGFFEFEFLGHVFGIATSRMWELSFDNYVKKTIEAKKGFFRRYRLIENFNDVDLTLSILDDYHRP